MYLRQIKPPFISIGWNAFRKLASNKQLVIYRHEFCVFVQKDAPLPIHNHQDGILWDIHSLRSHVVLRAGPFQITVSTEDKIFIREIVDFAALFSFALASLAPDDIHYLSFPYDSHLFVAARGHTTR